ncbi:hypothetical protein M1403_00230 [Patescibacteria group bacterium]|nr:hypothetical protein [Patescibacteria group bacterium]
MTLTAHSIIAAAIVSKVTNPAIGLPLVFTSHLLLDKVPHWDIMTNKNKSHQRIALETSADIILGFVAAAAFYLLRGPSVDPAYFFIAILVAQSPDLLEAPYIFPRFDNPVSKGVYKFQHYIHDLWFDARLMAPWGVISQVAVAGAFLLWSLT